MTSFKSGSGNWTPPDAEPLSWMVGLPECKQPDQTVLLCDARYCELNEGLFWQADRSRYWNSRAAFRHSRMVNALYIDGHVERIPMRPGRQSESDPRYW